MDIIEKSVSGAMEAFSGNLSESFVMRLYSLSSMKEYPDRVLLKARECLLDYLGCVLGASRNNREKIVGLLQETRSQGPSHIVGLGLTSDVRTAALCNGFNAHVLELDDSHRFAYTHLGASIFSSLLSVGELEGCTLGDLFRGAITGYEAAIRIGNAVQPSHRKRGFHSSGTCCTIGCAMGISAMLRYSYEEMCNVFAAATSTAAGLLEVIGGQSEQKPYNIAEAGCAGINAALFGKYYKGAADILDGKNGFLKAFTDEYHTDKLFDDGYAIETIYQKCYASCRHTHAPIEAILQIRNETGRPASDIESIDVLTYDLALPRHDHTEIPSVSSAKQSIPYSVAAAYYWGEAGNRAFGDEAIGNPVVSGLIGKVNLSADPGLSALLPFIRAAVVAVEYSDGLRIERRVDYPKGEPENPLSHEEILGKFFSLSSLSNVDVSKAKEVADTVFKCIDLPVSVIASI